MYSAAFIKHPKGKLCRTNRISVNVQFQKTTFPKQKVVSVKQSSIWPCSTFQNQYVSMTILETLKYANVQVISFNNEIQ